MEPNLQAIIGTDKKNSHFTVFNNLKEKMIDVYFGSVLFSAVADTPNNPKLLIAQLFNTGIKKKSLTEHFGQVSNLTILANSFVMYITILSEHQ